MFDKKIVIPTSLVDFIEDKANLTDEELGQVFRLVMEKVQFLRKYECREEQCDNGNGEIEHENRLVKFAAVTLYDGVTLLQA